MLPAEPTPTNTLWARVPGRLCTKASNSPTFQSYLKGRERKIKRALSQIEKRGAFAALDRCCVLTDQIDGDLRNKKLRHLFNNISLLAEFQVSIERAASLLDGIAAYGENQR
jgi:hypothetical protein